MERNEEKRLRELIRKELEAREELRPKGQLGESASSDLSEAERRLIIADEIRRFYEAKGNYEPYENEDGETEWLTKHEIAERERQIPIEIEELEEGQRGVRNHFLLIALLAFVGVALLLFALREKSGSIQVISNVEGARIYLNGQVTEFRTDHVIEDLAPGPHLITVAKSGYGIIGDPARKVDVRAGKEEIVTFQLELTVRQENGHSQN